ERGTVFDGFGRPVMATFKPPGGTVGIFASKTYLGFDGSDPQGRRVRTKELTDPVPNVNFPAAVGRTSTSFFDAYGRPSKTEIALGTDYANETLISGVRTYDTLGRVAFEADPYSASQDPATAYGTTHYYNIDGSIQLATRGPGPQPFTTAPDPTIERFPTWFTHTFANHQESMAVQLPDSLPVGSPQAGVVQASISTAIGQLIVRSAWSGGSRLEHMDFAYDRLGHRASMTRYQDPNGATQPVPWSWRSD